jgi:hypothetical protein
MSMRDDSTEESRSRISVPFKPYRRYGLFICYCVPKSWETAELKLARYYENLMNVSEGKLFLLEPNIKDRV